MFKQLDYTMIVDPDGLPVSLRNRSGVERRVGWTGLIL